MEKVKINLLELSDSERLKVLEQARAYLKKQVEEERYYRSIFLKSVKQGNMREKFRSLTNKLRMMKKPMSDTDMVDWVVEEAFVKD